MDYLLYVLIISLLLASASLLVRTTYSRYIRINTRVNKSSLEVVTDMKNKYGLSDLNIVRIGGVLSDHYDSRRKTIGLSVSNYDSSSVAGIAVAAHEMGHAIQDKEGYFFLRLRQGLGKITIVANNISWFIIYLGFILWYLPLVYAGIACVAIVVLFDIITLPVELDASRRAKNYLKSTGVYSEEEMNGFAKVLNAAAFTYIASTLAGILQLIRLLGIVSRDD